MCISALCYAHIQTTRFSALTGSAKTIGKNGPHTYTVIFTQSSFLDIVYLSCYLEQPIDLGN